MIAPPEQMHAPSVNSAEFSFSLRQLFVPELFNRGLILHGLFQSIFNSKSFKIEVICESSCFEAIHFQMWFANAEFSWKSTFTLNFSHFSSKAMNNFHHHLNISFEFEWRENVCKVFTLLGKSLNTKIVCDGASAAINHNGWNIQRSYFEIMLGRNTRTAQDSLNGGRNGNSCRSQETPSLCHIYTDDVLKLTHPKSNADLTFSFCCQDRIFRIMHQHSLLLLIQQTSEKIFHLLSKRHFFDCFGFSSVV